MPPNVIIRSMHEGARLNFQMDDWVKTEIANCVIIFGRLEQKVIEIAWDVMGANEVKHRIKAARTPASVNFEEILGAIEQLAGEKFEALRLGFETLAHDRNLIVHGAWLMVDDKPYVVWHKFLEDNDSVIGEYFERPRFEFFLKKANALLDMCAKWHTMISEERGTTLSTFSRVPSGL